MGEKELREYLRELGRRGGKARAKNLTEEQASNIGKKAAAARWAKLEKTVAEIKESTKELKQLARKGSDFNRRQNARLKKAEKLLKVAKGQ